MRHALAARLSAVALVGIGVTLLPEAAEASSRVTVANPEGQARIDPTYATTLRVSGSGFQSVEGGHGGIYVFFGTVGSGWRPSRGGVTGEDYFYVPDSESKDNQGFQRYVAFPGSDTASSANGGTMSASGAWSTEIVVPGARFQTYDRDGEVHEVDCRQATCGVITVGAHGVANGHNETFTPVTVAAAAPGPTTPGADESDPAPSDAVDADVAEPDASASGGGPASGRAPRAGAATALEVDRAAAVAGNVLAFSARGLSAGAQVAAVLDDGAAAAGPFVAGVDGTLAGVITLPAQTGPGTHELRLFGVDDAPATRFAVRAAPVSAAADPIASPAADPAAPRAAWLFCGAAALVLAVALVRLGVRAWPGRRRAS